MPTHDEYFSQLRPFFRNKDLQGKCRHKSCNNDVYMDKSPELLVRAIVITAIKMSFLGEGHLGFAELHLHCVADDFHVIKLVKPAHAGLYHRNYRCLDIRCDILLQ